MPDSSPSLKSSDELDLLATLIDTAIDQGAGENTFRIALRVALQGVGGSTALLIKTRQDSGFRVVSIETSEASQYLAKRREFLGGELGMSLTLEEDHPWMVAVNTRTVQTFHRDQLRSNKRALLEGYGIAHPIIGEGDPVGLIIVVGATPYGEGDVIALHRIAGILGLAWATRHHKLERKRLQTQLQQSQRLETLGRLAGGIAHDFNNLLTVIHGYGQLLMSDEPSETKREDLIDITRAAERGTSLVRQLLAFSRRQVLRPQLIDLSTLVLGLERMIRRLIGEDIKFVVKTREVPSIEADPGSIEQVILNLVVNARDAMPNGGRLMIQTAYAPIDAAHTRLDFELPIGEYVILSVIDDGCGMSPDIQDRIFEPFFTTKPIGKGTGLGLSMVYGIVRQTGGNISVYSEVGHGTAFKVFLPCSHLEASPEALVVGVEKTLLPTSNGTEYILVVEDDSAIRRFVTQRLRAAGYRVSEASNGRTAALFLQDHAAEITLVLSDVIMPEMGGIQLRNWLRETHPTLPVLLMSGYSEVFINAECELGDIGFLEKPFSESLLLRKIRTLIDERTATAPGEQIHE